MKSVNFRLPETSIEQLKQLSELLNDTKTAAIQYALQLSLQQEVASLQPSLQKDSCKDDCKDEKNDLETDWKKLYFAALKRNDELLDKLIELSGKLADSLQAAQALNAADKPLPLGDSGETGKPTRWQRLKAAWHN